jgi:PAS domain S-box-containing protein
MAFLLEHKFDDQKSEKLSFTNSLNVVYIVCGLVHLVFLWLFIQQNVVEMAIFNYFSPIIYLLCFLLNRRGYFSLSVFMGLGEAFSHGVFSTYYIGWDSGFYFYILLGFLLIFFLYRLPLYVKLLVTIPLVTIFVVAYLYTHTHQAIHILPDKILVYLHIANLTLVIAVLCLFGFLYTNYMWLVDKNLRDTIKEMKLAQVNLQEQIEENSIIQDELIKEKILLDALLENLPDYIYFKDRESRFIRMSRSMLKLFKVGRIEKMIGKTDFDFHPQKAAQKGRVEEEQIIKNMAGFVDKLEFEVLQNGYEQWVSVTKMPLISSSGQCIGTFGISKDVTYLKKLEIEANSQAKELLASKEELGKREEEQRLLNQQKIKFFSIFSHDLKNPLNSLLGFSELLWENYDRYDEAKKKKMLGDIVKIENQLKSLIVNLLDWSRSQLNNLSVYPEIILVKNMFQAVVSLNELQQNQKHITTVVDVDESLEFVSDIDILQTICRNLYSNALKYTNPGGRIVLQAFKEGSNLVVKVTDNGIGMSEQILQKLFSLTGEPSKTGTLNEKGTGLGLIVCNEYVTKCKGRIDVKSQLDKGSTFTVKIPPMELNPTE